jgi:hypothetical protein
VKLRKKRGVLVLALYKITEKTTYKVAFMVSHVDVVLAPTYRIR